jgi:hypothetical protein
MDDERTYPSGRPPVGRDLVKNLVYGESSWLVGDAAADAILDYAVWMAKTNSADTVDVVVLGPDGNEETTTLVLGPATMVQAQTTRSQLEEPENGALIEYVRTRLTPSTPAAQPLPAPADQLEWLDEQ